MIKEKIDIKLIFILILASILIFTLIFRPSKSINTHKDKINQLEQENKLLLSNNDSLKLINSKLHEEFDKLLIDINKTQNELDKTNDKIKDLENGKGKVSGYVNKLNADGVAKSLSDYLNRAKK